VWSEVWRQLLYVFFIVAGLVLVRSYGTVGAAAVVLAATATMTLLMHLLLTSVTPVRWIDVLRPQVPALWCALGVVAIELLVGLGFSLAGQQNANVWSLLPAQVAGAAVFYVTFVLFAPHRGLRTLVHEVAEDVAPPWLRRNRLVQRYTSGYFPVDAGRATGCS